MEPYEPMSSEEREECRRFAIRNPKRSELERLVFAANRMVNALRCVVEEGEEDSALEELESVLENTVIFDAIMTLERDRFLTSADMLEEEVGNNRH